MLYNASVSGTFFRKHVMVTTHWPISHFKGPGGSSVDWFKSFLMFGVAFYLVIAVLLYLFQERVIFYATPVDADHRYAFTGAAKEVWLESSGALLHGIIFPTSLKRRGVVLFFKGNAGNVGGLEDIAKIFRELGFDVLAMDYRGSGKSRGPLSESNLMADADLWFAWTAKTYAGEDIRLVGHSIGTAFACHVAAKHEARHTMLLAPMKSGRDMAHRLYPWLPGFLTRYPLRTDLALKNIKGQVVIYHGTMDRVVPFASGAALRPLLTRKDVFLAIQGASHNDLPWHPAVLANIRAQWGALSKQK